MPSFRYHDFFTCRQNRVQALTPPSLTSSDDPMINDRSMQSSTVAKNRRSTMISIPPTLINISNQEILSHIRVAVTLFFYNEESFEEVSYRSMDDIRKINPDECLWIDVTGVRRDSIEGESTLRTLFRFMITIY